jgi:hemoglobin-like flavoprotein
MPCITIIGASEERRPSNSRIAGENIVSAHDEMEQSLELIAQAGTDVAPLFFEKLYERFPGEKPNFLNPDHSHGAMANEMITMLLALAQGEGWVPTMMRIQQFTHRSFGDIAIERYGQALETLVDTLRDAAGDYWQSCHEAAWRAQTAHLFQIIKDNSCAIAPQDCG